MGIAHRAEPSVGCTFDVWDGEVSAEDIRQHLIRLADDPKWPAGHAHLTDLTTLTNSPVPDPDVLDALYEGTGLADDLKVAVVVPADFPTDISLQYSTVTERLVARTFTDIGLACAYLGVDQTRAHEVLDDLGRGLRRAAAPGFVD